MHSLTTKITENIAARLRYPLTRFESLSTARDTPLPVLKYTCIYTLANDSRVVTYAGTYTKKFRSTAFPERTIKGSRLCRRQRSSGYQMGYGGQLGKHACMCKRASKCERVYRRGCTHVQANCIVREHVEGEARVVPRAKRTGEGSTLGRFRGTGCGRRAIVGVAPRLPWRLSARRPINSIPMATTDNIGHTPCRTTTRLSVYASFCRCPNEKAGDEED